MPGARTPRRPASPLGSPNPKVEQQPPVTNHNFVSEDNQWKLNLTKDFIALSTLHYPGWEEFARQLDKPLAPLSGCTSPPISSGWACGM